MSKRKRRKHRAVVQRTNVVQLQVKVANDRGVTARTPESKGPIERMWRGGVITAEQFWVGSHFAACYDARFWGPGVSAAPLARIGSGGLGFSQVDHFRRLSMMASDYDVACDYLDDLDKKIGMIGVTKVVVKAAAVDRMSLDAIDAILKKRKQWARMMVLSGLRSLERLWGDRIKRQKTEDVVNFGRA